MSIFLMGVYDPNTFRWCTVTKCGNGLDDKMINRLQRELDVKKISRVFCFRILLTVFFKLEIKSRVVYSVMLITSELLGKWM